MPQLDSLAGCDLVYILVLTELVYIEILDPMTYSLYLFFEIDPCFCVIVLVDILSQKTVFNAS